MHKIYAVRDIEKARGVVPHLEPVSSKVLRTKKRKIKHG